MKRFRRYPALSPTTVGITPDLLYRAQLLPQPRRRDARAYYKVSRFTPPGVCWYRWRGRLWEVFVNWRAVPPVTADRLVRAARSATGAGMAEALAAREAIVQAADLARTRGVVCPWCLYDTHLDTCLVLKIRRGELLSMPVPGGPASLSPDSRSSG